VLADSHAHKRRERSILAAGSRSPFVGFGEVNADEHMASSATRSGGRATVRSLSGKTHAPSILGTHGAFPVLAKTAADLPGGSERPPITNQAERRLVAASHLGMLAVRVVVSIPCAEWSPEECLRSPPPAMEREAAVAAPGRAGLAAEEVNGEVLGMSREPLPGRKAQHAGRSDACFELLEQVFQTVARSPGAPGQCPRHPSQPLGTVLRTPPEEAPFDAHRGHARELPRPAKHFPTFRRVNAVPAVS